MTIDHRIAQRIDDWDRPTAIGLIDSNDLRPAEEVVVPISGRGRAASQNNLFRPCARPLKQQTERECMARLGCSVSRRLQAKVDAVSCPGLFVHESRGVLWGPCRTGSSGSSQQASATCSQDPWLRGLQGSRAAVDQISGSARAWKGSSLTSSPTTVVHEECRRAFSWAA